MPNKNYIAGRKQEYKIINLLKSKGFPICFRSAGSHSPIDVVAIDAEHRRMLLIQAKPKSMSRKEKDRIEKEHLDFNRAFAVFFKVCDYDELIADFKKIEDLRNAKNKT